jgi:hypothetical protein
MGQNPNEAPKADAIVALHRANVQSKYRVGLLMMASGFILPFVAVGLAIGLNNVAAYIEPAPNQGMMFLTGLFSMASVVVSVTLFAIGICLAWTNRGR